MRLSRSGSTRLLLSFLSTDKKACFKVARLCEHGNVWLERYLQTVVVYSGCARKCLASSSPRTRNAFDIAYRVHTDVKPAVFRMDIVYLNSRWRYKALHVDMASCEQN